MTQNDVRNLIRALDLRDCWGKVGRLEEWDHDQRLAVLVWYLTYLPRRQALRVIRSRLTGLASGHPGIATAAWAEGVAEFLDGLPEELDLETRLARVCSAFPPALARAG